MTSPCWMEAVASVSMYRASAWTAVAKRRIDLGAAFQARELQASGMGRLHIFATPNRTCRSQFPAIGPRPELQLPDQPQAHLGRHLRHSCRRDGKSVRPGRPRPAAGPSRHQQGAERCGPSGVRPLRQLLDDIVASGGDVAAGEGSGSWPRWRRFPI